MLHPYRHVIYRWAEFVDQSAWLDHIHFAHTITAVVVSIHAQKAYSVLQDSAILVVREDIVCKKKERHTHPLPINEDINTATLK